MDGKLSLHFDRLTRTDASEIVLDDEHAAAICKLPCCRHFVLYIVEANDTIRHDFIRHRGPWAYVEPFRLGGCADRHLLLRTVNQHAQEASDDHRALRLRTSVRSDDQGARGQPASDSAP